MKGSEPVSNDKNKIGVWHFAGLLVVVVGMWLGYTYWLPSAINNAGSRGLYGDSYGALNTLFSGLAFAALVFTMLLQRNELQLQRQELRETREQLKVSADSQAELADLQLISSMVSAKSAILKLLREIEWGDDNMDMMKDRYKEELDQLFNASVLVSQKFNAAYEMVERSAEEPGNPS